MLFSRMKTIMKALKKNNTSNNIIDSKEIASILNKAKT